MKKLSLSKETVKTLSSDQAQGLAAAAPPTRYWGDPCSIDYCFTVNLSCQRGITCWCTGDC